VTVEAAFELFEITADVGVSARGSTLAAAFEQAARGMYAVMVELDGVEERESRTVELDAAPAERQLERWLLELLFLTESEDLLFSRFEVVIEESGALRGVAYGERLDRARHELGPEVKAVTRHLLAVRALDGGFEVRVVFDI